MVIIRGGQRKSLKLRRKRNYSKPQKIIAPQAQLQAQVWHFEKYNSNLLTAQTSLCYDTKPIFKTNYALCQVSKRKIIDFL